MSVLGKNLKELIDELKCKGQLSLWTVLKIGIQLIDKLRVLHLLQIVHWDIKPHNIMFGIDDKGKGMLYLVDFGLAAFLSENSPRSDPTDEMYLK